jgi:hypothetical protein
MIFHLSDLGLWVPHAPAPPHDCAKNGHAWETTMTSAWCRHCKTRRFVSPYCKACQATFPEPAPLHECPDLRKTPETFRAFLSKATETPGMIPIRVMRRT